MNDENTDASDNIGTPASGNRWESADVPTDASVEQPVARSRFTGARAGVAAGAAAALVAVGLGGFAVGRATGDDGAGGPGIQQVGFQSDGDDDGDGRGFGDRDGDGDHGFPPQGGLPPGAPNGTIPDGTTQNGTTPDGSDT